MQSQWLQMSVGVVKFVDIVDHQTMREELDEGNGDVVKMTIIEDRSKKLHPTIQICKKNKKGRGCSGNL